MSGECGIVVEIVNDDMRVEAEPGQACVACAGKESCMFSKNRTMRSLWMRNTPGAVRGDVVEFEFRDNAVVKASLIAYGLPVVLLIAGIAVGGFSAGRLGIEKDLASILAGVIGMMLAFLIVKFLSGRPALKKSMGPVALRIVSEKDKKA